MNRKGGNKGRRERNGGEKEERKKRKKTDALKHPTIEQKDMKTNKCTKML